MFSPCTACKRRPRCGDSRKGEGTHRVATARSACLPVILEESWAGRAAWEESRRRADHSMPGSRAAAATRTPAFENRRGAFLSRAGPRSERDGTKRARRSHAKHESRASRPARRRHSRSSGRKLAANGLGNSNPRSLASRRPASRSSPRVLPRSFFRSSREILINSFRPLNCVSNSDEISPIRPYDRTFARTKVMWRLRELRKLHSDRVTLAFDYAPKRSSQLSEDFVYFDLLGLLRAKVGARNHVALHSGATIIARTRSLIFTRHWL